MLIDAVTDEVTTATLGLGEARAASRTASRGLIAAEEAYRVRREQRDLGRGTAVELVDSESDVLRARLELVHARVDARVARAHLDHAVGGKSGAR
ncbi:MAG: TolC family protein [Deltaproteobacteria bacterium]|nr:TolC family protein [Deltaproteobacteria bacterium]